MLNLVTHLLPPAPWFIKELQCWWCWRGLHDGKSRADRTNHHQFEQIYFLIIQIYFSTETNIFGNLNKYICYWNKCVCKMAGARSHQSPPIWSPSPGTRHTPVPAHPGWSTQDRLKYKHTAPDSKWQGCQDYNISNLTGSPYWANHWLIAWNFDQTKGSSF